MSRISTESIISEAKKFWIGTKRDSIFQAYSRKIIAHCKRGKDKQQMEAETQIFRLRKIIYGTVDPITHN